MSEDDLNFAFPAGDPGVTPLGSRVLVQVRTPESKTRGGIILTDSDKDTQLWNTTVARVLSVGVLAFHNRNTAEPWPEGAWCVAGDYVRVPKYGGDRWVSDCENGQKAYYGLVNDLDILGKVTGDPLQLRSFL